MKEMEILFRVSVLVFVIGGMLATGLSLSIWHILAPLKNTKRVVLSLIANFVLVPVIVYGIVTVIPVSEGVRIGLILLSLSAGAPLLPKLVDIAKNSAAFAIGLMLLLMTVTIFYLPIVLPRLLTDIEVSSWAIAKSLIILMLIPLLAALFVKAHYECLAKRLQPVFAKITNIALIAIAFSLIILHHKNLMTLVGYGLLAVFLSLLAAMAVGYLLGTLDKDTRVVLCLGTGQRNITAAILVATQNFNDPEIALVMIASTIVGLIIMIPYAAMMAKRASQ